MSRKKFIVILSCMVVLVCTLAITFTTVASSTTNAHAAPARPLLTPVSGGNHGCPAGYVCIYPQNAGWNGDHPSLKYYNYGVYQLHNQFGTHYLFNNQTSGAWVWLCTDWNGNNRAGRYASPALYVVNLTPINSIRLTP